MFIVKSQSFDNWKQSLQWLIGLSKQMILYHSPLMHLTILIVIHALMLTNTQIKDKHSNIQLY